jgi:peptidoglycan/LPS O-acetylase OafA/YrhL
MRSTHYRPQWQLNAQEQRSMIWVLLIVFTARASTHRLAAEAATVLPPLLLLLTLKNVKQQATGQR